MYPTFDKATKFPNFPKQGVSPQPTFPPQENVRWEWYDPPEDSLPVAFCNDTSLHGLRYVGQPKRHICERLFWFIAFLAAVSTSSYFIWIMYNAYISDPLITVFNPSETTIDEIPFPAITICNVNNVRKSKALGYLSELLRSVGIPPPPGYTLHEILGHLALQANPFKTTTPLPKADNETILRKFARVLDVKHICEAAKTFTGTFVSGSEMKQLVRLVETFFSSQTHDVEKYHDTTGTLKDATQSCNKMILFCQWLDVKESCEKLFQEIETDYGYCCTFNTIPLSLLMRHQNDTRDDPDRVQEWKEAELNYDNLMFTKDTKHTRKVPLRQLHSGRSAGLSIMLDPDLDEYMCTNTDSQGFMLAVNVPLDFPRLRDHGMAIPPSSEVFVSIRPEVTIADKSARAFNLKKRNCYFGGERRLPNYFKYTTSNCMDECISTRTRTKCGCIRYYMPHGEHGAPHCKPHMYNCTDEVRKDIIQRGLDDACEHCLPTCTEIQYFTETTSLPTNENNIQELKNNFPEIRDKKKLSIVHVYFSVDSTYPRRRQEVTSTTNLISNAGGLLGLCMGFSMLSLLEILYHLTLRLACLFYRKKMVEKTEQRYMAIAFFSKVYNRPAVAQNLSRYGTPTSSNYLDYYKR